jgi:hypothetical protein
MVTPLKKRKQPENIFSREKGLQIITAQGAAT